MTESIATHDGLTLVVERNPLPSPRARMVIVHGYAEHRGRYAALVEQLTQAGIECHRFDLRGHGESGGRSGHVPRFTDYLDDLQRVTATVPHDLPRLLLGHSLGGLISLHYVKAHPDDFDAIAVSSPFLAPTFAVPKAQEVLASVASQIAPWIPIKTPLRPSMVSRDPEVVAAYRDDPAVFRTTTPRWYTEVKEAQRVIFEHAADIRLPALFLLAQADQIADHALAREVFHRLGSQDKELEVFDGFYHEVFNEIGREKVIARLLAWVGKRC